MPINSRLRVPLSSTHQFHTKGPLLFSPQNSSVPHKNSTSFQPPKSLSSTPKTPRFNTPPPQFNTPLSSIPKTEKFWCGTKGFWCGKKIKEKSLYYDLSDFSIRSKYISNHDYGNFDQFIPNPKRSKFLKMMLK